MKTPFIRAWSAIAVVALAIILVIAGLVSLSGGAENTAAPIIAVASVTIIALVAAAQKRPDESLVQAAVVLFADGIAYLMPAPNFALSSPAGHTAKDELYKADTNTGIRRAWHPRQHETDEQKIDGTPVAKHDLQAA